MAAKKEDKTLPDDAYNALMEVHTFGSGDDDQSGKAFQKFIDELYSDENIVMKTDLNPGQMIPFARAELFTDIYKCKPMRQFLDHLYRLNISKKRAGRTEWVDVTRNVNSHYYPEEIGGGFGDRLLGKG